MKAVICLLIGASIFFSCKKTNHSEGDGCESPSTKTVTLNNCAPKLAGENHPEICFLELNDSRCPANAVCIWQGVAIAKFSFKTASTQHLLTLSTSKMTGMPPMDTVVSGYHVQLVDVTPYPGTSPQPAQATLRITR